MADERSGPKSPAWPDECCGRGRSTGAGGCQDYGTCAGMMDEELARLPVSGAAP
jgi:hypothetical protein